ncbi:MAG: FecR domain-containing protein [Terriglobia bacterium]
MTAQIPQAQVSRPGETLSADVGTEVLWDDLVETERRGRVRITLGDGSVLNMGSDSSLRVVRHDAQSRQTDLTLTFGRMRSRVQGLQPASGQRFEVRTNTAVLGVIGTDFYVEATGTQTIVIVYEGVVLVTNISPAILGSVQVFAGQQTVVNTGQPPQPPSPSDPAQVQDSLQETNVGEELPPPQVRQPPKAGPSAKWPLIIIISTIAVLSIVLPIVTNNNDQPPPPTLSPPTSRGGGNGQ